MDDVKINRVETFQNDSVGDLIIFKIWILKINMFWNQRKTAGPQWNNQQWELPSSESELLTFFSVKNIITNTMFLQNISILTKQHFLVEDILVKNLSTKCTSDSGFDYMRTQCSFKCLKCKISPALCIAQDWEVN